MFGRLSLQTPVTDLLSPFLMEVCVAFFVCFFFAVTYSSDEFYFNFLPVQHLPGNQVILGKEYHTMLKKKNHEKTTKVKRSQQFVQFYKHCHMTIIVRIVGVPWK